MSMLCSMGAWGLGGTAGCGAAATDCEAEGVVWVKAPDNDPIKLPREQNTG